MKIAFVCSFDLERLTGTPIRAKTTMNVATEIAEVSVVASVGFSFNPKIDSHIIGAGSLIHFSRRVWNELKKIKPDVIHGFTTVSMIPIFLYKIFSNWKVKVVFEMHGWTWFETKGELAFWKRAIFYVLDSLGFIFSNAVIVMSHTQKGFLVKKFYQKNNLEVYWGPVDFGVEFKESENTSQVVVGYLGNKSFWQGLSGVLSAAKILQKEQNIHFKLAGFEAGDEKTFPKLSNVTYVGKVERKNVPDFIKSCDFMLSPRIKGKVSDLQYPHKLSEYLASGRPVIASDVSDQKKIINDAKCGEVVNPLTPESLAEALKKMGTKTKEERVEMGKNAVKYAKENFSVEILGRKLKLLYQNLLKK